jgi:hypothetical protein
MQRHVACASFVSSVVKSDWLDLECRTLALRWNAASGRVGNSLVPSVEAAVSAAILKARRRHACHYSIVFGAEATVGLSIRSTLQPAAKTFIAGSQKPKVRIQRERTLHPIRKW